MAKKNTPSINLGNLDNIEDINRFLNKVVHDMMSSIAEDHEAAAKSTAPSYSFSVHIDHNGIPVISNLGNPKVEAKSEPQQKPVPHVEPLADVIETENTVSVLAEAHGAAKEDISLKCDGTLLTIAIKGSKSYSKSLTLPAVVTPRGAAARLNSGILEITMKKVRAYNGKTVNIKLK